MDDWGLFEILIGDAGSMCMHIVIHQNEIFTNSTCIWANVNIQDLVYIPESHQRAVVNDMEVRFPLSTYYAQTMTEPPPNRSCSATQTGAKRSFGILHTLARLSVKSTQNLDSSVNRTGPSHFGSKWHDPVPMLNTFARDIGSTEPGLQVVLTSGQHHATDFWWFGYLCAQG